MAEPGDLPQVLTDRVAFQLQRAVQLAQAMGEQSLAELGLTGREYGVLALLGTDTPTAQHRIGAALGVDRTSTASLVGGLDRRGLVRRVRQPDDRRAYAVTLTDDGERLRARAAAVLAECDDQFLRPLDPADRRHLRRVLQVLLGEAPDRRPRDASGRGR